MNIPRGHEVPAHAVLLLHLEREAEFLRAVELQVLLGAVLSDVFDDFIVFFSTIFMMILSHFSSHILQCNDFPSHFPIIISIFRLLNFANGVESLMSCLSYPAVRTPLAVGRLLTQEALLPLGGGGHLLLRVLLVLGLLSLRGLPARLGRLSHLHSSFSSFVNIGISPPFSSPAAAFRFSLNQQNLSPGETCGPIDVRLAPCQLLVQRAMGVTYARGNRHTLCNEETRDVCRAFQ